MVKLSKSIAESIRRELAIIWAAHKAVGLEGQMCIYSYPDKEPWIAKEKGINFWFGPEDTEKALELIAEHYNDGNLPNSTLLLNPIVFSVGDENNPPEPLGSGIFWALAPCQGIDRSNDDQLSRPRGIGIFSGNLKRGEVVNAGVKALGFSNRLLSPMDGMTVPGNSEVYEILNIRAEEYWRFYVLSGLSYLSRHGSYVSDDIESLGFDTDTSPEEVVKNNQVDIRKVMDAATCWDAYDRHQSLYDKFGIDPDNIEHNLRLYELCARDVTLFDATGPMRKGADETFEFVVPGYIPRGAVTLLAAAGGTGKSSAAHNLCIKAAIDYPEGEVPHWLGQPINTNLCDGISVYFSGEDGPAIINARGELFDPEHRAKRLMFMRTDFGDGVSFSGFLHRLHKLPNVPIMVIDPARKYLEGNEDDADVVSKFFEAIEEFAIERKAAVVVVHHLAKGAKPQSCREVLDCLRGSQVFIDRPRVVIGMYRDGPYTVVGLSKNNIPPNMGMVLEERVFARDPKSLSLIWLPGEKGKRIDTLTDEELEEIKGQQAEG